MCRTEDGVVRYAPLCIHTFRLIAPRKLLEAQLFHQQYHCYAEIQNVPDRLRWCRHRMGLMQKEVAKLAGISRANYVDLETGAVDYYPKEIVDKLAALFQIPVVDLLDDYNRFQYAGQGKLIREYRAGLGFSIISFAQWIGIDPSLLRAWETNQKRMNIHSWDKYFKDTIHAQLLELHMADSQ